MPKAGIPTNALFARAVSFAIDLLEIIETSFPLLPKLREKFSLIKKRGTDLVFRPNEVCPCLYDLYELGTDLDVFEVSPYLNYSIFFDNMSYEFSQKPNKDLFQLL